MREDQIIAKIRSELNSQTASDVDVRTAGGDQDVDPPEIIIEWTSRRLPNRAGHLPIVGNTTDASGNKTGYEYHLYSEMEINCTIRSYDEVERDKMLDSLQSYFLPFEEDSSKFHKDTGEWEVGGESPRGNPVIEPDWYEIGLMLSFEYVKRVTESEDTIEAVNKTVERND